MFAPILTVLPLKFFPSFTNTANPANCSALIMVNSLADSLYHLVSTSPFQTEDVFEAFEVVAGLSSQAKSEKKSNIKKMLPVILIFEQVFMTDSPFV
jgi:hypothetical protein